jgi:hypothetical protein
MGKTSSGKDSHICFGENYYQLQFWRIKGLFQEKDVCGSNKDSLHIATNVCSWADPKVYGYGRRKRSKLVPFLGDLGRRLLIRKDPSSSGKIR